MHASIEILNAHTRLAVIHVSFLIPRFHSPMALVTISARRPSRWAPISSNRPRSTQRRSALISSKRRPSLAPVSMVPSRLFRTVGLFAFCRFHTSAIHLCDASNFRRLADLFAWLAQQLLSQRLESDRLLEAARAAAGASALERAGADAKRTGTVRIDNSTPVADEAACSC